MGTQVLSMFFRFINQKRIRSIQTPGNMSMILGYDITSCLERLLLSLQAPQEVRTYLLFLTFDSPSVAIQMGLLLATQTLGLQKTKKKNQILVSGEARQFSLPNQQNLLRLSRQRFVMRRQSHLYQEVGFANWWKSVLTR